jgi:hypothetical protein
MRWREATDKLLGDSGRNVTTLVVIGHTQLPFSDDEAETLLAWVRRGGRLVLIDRQPDRHLLPTSGNWAVVSNELDLPTIDVDPNDQKQMTENVIALHPAQTTLLTENVSSVLPSRFSARIKLNLQKPGPPRRRTNHNTAEEQPEDGPQDSTSSPAPVVHVADRDGALLVDYSYGSGRVTLLADPYVVANNGINLNDNLQLAINTITSANGLVAFDEFHQGRGVTQNEFASYFAGTPVLAIAAQIVAIILLMLWTASRRFARPLPLVQVDRRSSLEFVASMSELQERSRAFDLAVENIYSRTRRVLARYAGVDYNSSRSDIATRVAMRSSVDAHSLETLMRQCEETINGTPTTWRQAIDMVRRLREVERTLGLRMRSRDVRQAADRI